MTTPVLEAMLVVALWASSPLLVKLALQELSPLSIAGVRYFASFLFLAPFIVYRYRHGRAFVAIGSWWKLAVMGILAFPVGNALLFTGLRTLSATTSAFILNAVPIVTLILGALLLRERPTPLQWLGLGVSLAGGALFFGEVPGVMDVRATLISLAGASALAAYGVMARDVARSGAADTVSLAAFPSLFGGGLLLAFAFPSQAPSARMLAVLAWLAVVNSAVAYVLWTHAMKRLKAFEISVIGNLLPVGTAIISPFFHGEPASVRAWLGMAVGLVGVVLVAWRSERFQAPKGATGDIA